MAQLQQYTGLVRDMPAPWRAAHLDLLTTQFLKNTYPTPESFGELFAVRPHTAAFAARWAEVRAQAAATTATTVSDEHGVSALAGTTRAGDLVGLCAVQVVWGGSSAPVAETIGSAASTLPTHRFLQGFRYPPEVGFDAAITPETALAEFGRIATRNADDLRDLVHAGEVTLDQVHYVALRGRDTVLAAVYAFAETQRHVLGYIGNTRYRLARAFARRGLPILPLYLDGSEPTPRIRQAGNYNTPLFRRWEAELAEVVPAGVIGGGIAAAVRWLAGRDFDGWDTLSVSLPFIFVNDARLASAMAHLATNAATCPGGLVRVPAVPSLSDRAVA